MRNVERMKHARNLDQDLYPVCITVAAVIVLGSLGPGLFIVVKGQFPQYIGWVTALYVGTVFLALFGLMRMLRRRGYLNMPSPVWKPTIVLLGGTGLITGILMLSLHVWPSLVGLWLVLYVGVILYGTYLYLHWMAKHLAFRCPECGLVFQGSQMTWMLSMNMGTRKHVNCPRCAKPQWVDIVAPSVQENPPSVDRPG